MTASSAVTEILLIMGYGWNRMTVATVLTVCRRKHTLYCDAW